MEPSDKTRILCRLNYLATNTTSLDRLTSLLLSEGGLTVNETKDLLDRSSDYKRCAFLYEKILTQGPKMFGILLKCLRRSGNDRIADRLTEDLTTEEAENFKHIFEEGLEADLNSNSWCWSGFIGEEMYPVRILSRDVSGGLVSAYHAGHFKATSWMYPLGILFNREGLRTLPKRLHHSGLWIYDKVYEYEVNGLRIVNTIDSGFKVLSRQSTRKTAKEFEAWLDTQKELYQKEYYHAVAHNCLKFTQAACEFLQILFPPELQQMQEFVHKNPKSVKFFSFRSVSGGARIENDDGGTTNSDKPQRSRPI